MVDEVSRGDLSFTARKWFPELKLPFKLEKFEQRAFALLFYFIL